MTDPTVPIQPTILYFGTPVVLVTTENPDGIFNITPISSAWALGNHVVLGLGEGSRGLANLRERGECVLNLPADEAWQRVEALAPTTGMDPVPMEKQPVFHFTADKWAVAGFTPRASHRVRPPRIAECPLQLEAAAVRIVDTSSSVAFAIVEVEVLTVHAHADLVADGHHIRPEVWRPLIYNFRHYFGLGPHLGKTIRAER